MKERSQVSQYKRMLGRISVHNTNTQSNGGLQNCSQMHNLSTNTQHTTKTQEPII